VVAGLGVAAVGKFEGVVPDALGEIEGTDLHPVTLGVFDQRAG
jgi:hypothetical protein